MWLDICILAYFYVNNLCVVTVMYIYILYPPSVNCCIMVLILPDQSPFCKATLLFRSTKSWKFSIWLRIYFICIFTLSSSIFTVLVGFAILSYGLKIKDPEVNDAKEKNHVEQLTIFSEEVLEPSIIKEVKKKVSKKAKA